MAFPIRKNTSMGVPSSTIDSFLTKKLVELGIRKAQTEPNGTDDVIGQKLEALKNEIYGFIEDLQRVQKASRGAPILALQEIPRFNSLSAIMTELDDMSIDAGPALEQAGLDVESLEMALELMSEADAKGGIANSQSRRTNYGMVNDKQLIESLSFLMEIAMPDTDDYSLEDDPDFAVPERRSMSDNLIRDLISGTPEDRDKVLKRYGLSEEVFNKILTENRFITKKDVSQASPQQLEAAYKRFVEAAILQGSTGKVKLDRRAFNISAFLKALESQKRLGEHVSGDNTVAIPDYLGNEFFRDYFSDQIGGNRKKITDDLSPALSAFVSDITYSAFAPESGIRNVSSGLTIEEAKMIDSSISSLASTGPSGSVDVSGLTRRVEQLKAKINIAPPPIRPQIEAEIKNLEAQIQAAGSQQTKERSDKDLVDTLSFGKLSPKDQRAVQNSIVKMNKAYGAYKRNKGDLGALGVALDNYARLYNVSEGKSFEQAKKIENAQNALFETPWFRFLSPAYRFMESANEFMYLIGVKRSGIEADTSREEFQKIFNQIQDLYIDISNNPSSQKLTINKMSKLSYLAMEFLAMANMALTGEVTISQALKAVAEMYKYQSLMEVNYQDPENVLVFKSWDKNKEQGQKTANLHTSDFTIVPTYRIERHG